MKMKKIMVAVMAVIMVIAMSSVSFAASRITEKEAVSKALNDAGLKKSEVRGLDSEYEHGKYEIEFTRKSNKAEYDYEISGKGRILEKSVDYRYKHNSSKSKIGKAAAQKKVADFSGIALKTIKTGTCTYEYDREDREGTYDIEFYKGKYKYEYEVLAPNGKIIDYSKEYKG